MTIAQKNISNVFFLCVCLCVAKSTTMKMDIVNDERPGRIGASRLAAERPKKMKKNDDYRKNILDYDYAHDYCSAILSGEISRNSD